MQTSKHFSLFQLIAVIFISNFCISSCEIPIPNNFGSAPEYGHIIYPDQQSTINNTSKIFKSYWNDSSKNPNTEENSLEALSSVPHLHYYDDNDGESESYYNSGETINDLLEPDYRFHHSNDESLLYENNNEYENNQNEIYNNNQQNGRGFEAPSSSSSLIQLLMSPLSKPFSLIPSVFRKGKKKRRGGKRRARRRRRNRRHPSTIKKGRRSQEASRIYPDDDYDNDDDLNVGSSDSSAGHYQSRKRKRGGRGRINWRVRGRGRDRGRKRRRKPKRLRKSRTKKPHQYNDYYDYEEDYDGYKDNKVVPIKVNYYAYDGDRQINDNLKKNPHHHNELSFESHPNNNNNNNNNNYQPDFYKHSEEKKPLASFGNFNLNQDNQQYPQSQNSVDGHGRWTVSNGSKQHLYFPRSIYDKLPPTMPITTTYNRHSDPPKNLKTMRPPIGPHGVSSSQHNGYQYIAENQGSALNHESASIHFPNFPPPSTNHNTNEYNGLPVYKPSTYMLPSQHHSTEKFKKFPSHRNSPLAALIGYINGITSKSIRPRSHSPMPMGLKYQHPMEKGYFVRHPHTDWMRTPVSQLSPQLIYPNEVIEEPEYFENIPSQTANPIPKSRNVEYNNVEEVSSSNQFMDNHPNDLDGQSVHLKTPTPPQIIYGQWNPLVDRMDNDK